MALERAKDRSNGQRRSVDDALWPLRSQMLALRSTRKEDFTTRARCVPHREAELHVL